MGDKIVSSLVVSDRIKRPDHKGLGLINLVSKENISQHPIVDAAFRGLHIQIAGAFIAVGIALSLTGVGALPGAAIVGIGVGVFVLGEVLFCIGGLTLHMRTLEQDISEGERVGRRHAERMYWAMNPFTRWLFSQKIEVENKEQERRSLTSEISREGSVESVSSTDSDHQLDWDMRSTSSSVDEREDSFSLGSDNPFLVDEKRKKKS